MLLPRTALVAAVAIFLGCDLRLDWENANQSFDIQFRPIGVNISTQELHIRFAEPPSPPSDPDKKTCDTWLEIKPLLNGNCRWDSKQHLIFRPSDAFRSSTEYKVVAKTGNHRRHFSFKTDMFRVESIFTRLRLSAAVQIVVAFSHPIDPTVAQNLVLIRDDQGRPLNKVLQTNPSTKELVFSLSKDFSPGKEITVRVDRQMGPLFGGTALLKDVVRKISTAERPFSLTDIHSQRFGIESGIRLRFSHPPDPASVDKSITVIPSTPFRPVTEDENIVLLGLFEPQGKYRVKISPSLKSVDGKALNQDQEVSVKINPTGAHLVLEPLIFEMSSKNALILRSVQVPAAEFRATKVSPEQLLQSNCWQSWQRPPPRHGPCMQKIDDLLDRRKASLLPLGSPQAPLSETRLPSSRLKDMAPSQNGIYLLGFNDPKRPWIRARTIVRAHGMEVSAKRGPKEVSAYVHSTDTGVPLTNVRVTAFSPTGRVLANASTDSEGFARLNPNPEGTIVAVFAEQPPNYALLVMPHPAEHKSLLPAPSWRVFVHTDRPQYAPGDSMQILTLMREGAMRARSKSFSLELWDSHETLLQTVRRSSSSFGVDSHEIDLPGFMSPGSYTLRVRKSGQVAIGRHIRIDERVHKRKPAQIVLNQSVLTSTSTPHGRLALRLDKVNYRTGDWAQLAAHAPSPGRLWVAVQRNSVLWQRTTRTDGGEVSMRIPVRTSFSPNAYVHAIFFPDSSPVHQSLTHVSEERWIDASMDLRIHPDEHRLDLKLDAPSVVNAGEDFSIRVKSESGRGESSLFTTVLNVEDKLDPLPYFMRAHQHQVESFGVHLNSTISTPQERPRPATSPESLSWSEPTSLTSGTTTRVSVSAPHKAGFFMVAGLAASRNRFGYAAQRIEVRKNVLAPKKSSLEPSRPLFGEAVTITNQNSVTLTVGKKKPKQSRLMIGPSPIYGYATAFQRLNQVPDSSLISTVSRGFPLLFAADLAESLGVLQKNPQELLGDATAQVASLQMDNGSFRTWPQGPQAAEWENIYGHHFLIEAKKKGLPVDARNLRQSQAYLLRTVYSSSKPFEQAYALYVLDRIGSPDARQAVRQKRDILQAIEEEGLFPIPTSHASGLDLDALAFFALSDLSPPKEVQVRVLEQLTAKAKQGQWSSLFANAYALSALAKLEPVLLSPFPYWGALAQSGEVQLRFNDRRPVFLNLDNTNPPQRIDISVTGRGTAYAGYSFQENLPQEPKTPTVRIDAETSSPSGAALKDGQMIKAGAVVVHRLRITRTSTTHGEQTVRVVVPLADGFTWHDVHHHLNGRTLPWMNVDPAPEFLELKQGHLVLFFRFSPGQTRDYYFSERAPKDSVLAPRPLRGGLIGHPGTLLRMTPSST